MQDKTNAPAQIEMQVDELMREIDHAVQHAFNDVAPVKTMAKIRERLHGLLSGKCLHQIQEPAAAEQAAWHAGLDEGRAQAAQPSSVSNAETPQAAPAAVAVPDGGTPGLWSVRKREVDGELRDCFVTAPDCQGLPYDAEIMGDDEYRDDNGIARKLADCELIVTAVNAYRAALAVTPAADAPLDFLPFSARAAIASRHGMKVTAEFNALVREVIAEYRARAVPSDIAAAAPVVLPEPALHVSGGQLERHCDPEDKNGGRYIPARKTAAGLFTTPLYTEQQVRALLATATGLPAQASWLQPKDLESLLRFEETASDNQGHDIGKAAATRLAGFGCLQSHGFGVYSITDFGHFVLDDWEHARALPFRTQEERDADHRAAITTAKGE